MGGRETDGGRQQAERDTMHSPRALKTRQYLGCVLCSLMYCYAFFERKRPLEMHGVPSAVCPAALPSPFKTVRIANQKPSLHILTQIFILPSPPEICYNTNIICGKQKESEFLEILYQKMLAEAAFI